MQNDNYVVLRIKVEIYIEYRNLQDCIKKIILQCKCVDILQIQKKMLDAER